jgi:phosphoglycerol transferase
MNFRSNENAPGKLLAPAALALALVLVFLVLAGRNHGLYPLVFADEWSYSRAARLEPLAQSIVPSYLYLKLFSVTNACGTGFLECARLLNALLFVAAAPFIYLAARRALGKPAAALVAVASVLAPINSHTAYFMPESTYFFGFWAVSWLLLSWQGRPGVRLGVVAGALLGLLALVKVHALFLLPAAGAFMLWRGWREGSWRGGVLAAVLLGLTALAVKTALGYLLAGPAGLGLLGSFYGKHASNSHGSLAHLLAPLVRSLYGHAMALGLLFALPMLAAFATLASPQARARLAAPGQALVAYAALMLGATLLMTGAFTASIADGGPEEALRLHMRYYDFVFPLLLMLGASLAEAAPAAFWKRLLLAAPCAFLLWWAWTKLPFYKTGFVDSPELGALVNVAYPDDTRLLVQLQWAAMACWVAWPLLGRMVFLCVVLPFATIAASANIGQILGRAAVPNAYDQAGLYARHALDGSGRAGLAVAGDDLSGLARAQFHIDSPGSSTIALQPGEALDPTLLPARRPYLLVVGRHALPEGIEILAHRQAFALLKLGSAPRTLHKIAFSDPQQGGVLAAATGLADKEPWGSWSNAKRVTLRFAQPLPERLALFINGRAFGPNVGKDFVLAVGGASRTFRLPASEQEVYLQLPTDGRQRELSIDIPAPTTPQEAGTGNDKRALGIGLVSLEIAEKQ